MPLLLSVAVDSPGCGLRLMCATRAWHACYAIAGPARPRANVTAVAVLLTFRGLAATSCLAAHTSCCTQGRHHNRRIECRHIQVELLSALLLLTCHPCCPCPKGLLPAFHQPASVLRASHPTWPTAGASQSVKGGTCCLLHPSGAGRAAAGGFPGGRRQRHLPAHLHAAGPDGHP